MPMTVTTDTSAGELNARTQRSPAGVEIARAACGPTIQLTVRVKPCDACDSLEPPDIDRQPSKEDDHGDLCRVSTHGANQTGETLELHLNGARDR